MKSIQNNAVATLLIILLLVVIHNMTVMPVLSRINCEADPEHPYCNSELGRNGIPFCDLQIQVGICYDRYDNPEEYCEKYGEDDKDFCEMIAELGKVAYLTRNG